MKGKVLTILFADIQGYFPRVDHQAQPGNPKLADELKAIVDANSETHNGTFLKTMNNGVLLAFESPTDGVRCARDILTQIETRNDGAVKKNDFTRFRIGVSTGEIRMDLDGKVQGEALDAAMRLQNFAEANNAYIAESTYQAADRTGILTENIGQDAAQTTVYKILKKISAGPHPFQQKSMLPMLFAFIALANASILISVFIVMARQKPDIEELMAKRNYKGVVALAPDLLAHDPKNLPYHGLIIQAFVNLGDLEGMESYLQAMIEAEAADRGFCQATAEYLAENGNYQAAGEIMEKYCESMPAKFVEDQAAATASPPSPHP